MRRQVGSLLIDACAARAGGGIGVVQDLVLGTRELAPRTHVLVLASQAIVSVLDPLPPNVTLIPISHGGGVPGRILRQQLVVPWRLRRVPLLAVIGPLGSFPMAFALRRVPTAVTVSNVSPFDARLRPRLRLPARIRLSMLGFFTGLSVRLADTTWALSSTSLSAIVQNVTPRSAGVLPMVPPGPHNISSGNVRRSNRTFVSVGDLYPHKAIEDAVQAIGRIAAAGTQAELLICGREMDPAYVRRLRILAKDNEVRFVGGKDRPSAIRLIANARGLIHCSRMESLGRPLTEAMYVGTPIVAAELPVTREVCGDAAWYYEPGDVEGLAGLMSRLLWDDKAATELGGRGPKRMEGRTWLDAPQAILARVLGVNSGAGLMDGAS